MYKQARICLSVVVLLSLFVAARAQTIDEKPTLPAYTRLSDDAILKMGLPEFSFRYGQDDSGRGSDDRLHYYASCLARRNDRRARAASAATATRLVALRVRLTAWDERRFTPAQRYTGGTLEQGHQDATFHIEREQFLQTLIPSIGKKRISKISAEEKKAMVAFRAWVKQSEEDSVPMPEQLSDEDAVSKKAIRLNYAAWYALLKDEARRVEATALSLPSPSAARVLQYVIAQ